MFYDSDRIELLVVCIDKQPIPSLSIKREMICAFRSLSRHFLYSFQSKIPFLTSKSSSIHQSETGKERCEISCSVCLVPRTRDQ